MSTILNGIYDQFIFYFILFLRKSLGAGTMLNEIEVKKKNGIFLLKTMFISKYDFFLVEYQSNLVIQILSRISKL